MLPTFSMAEIHSGKRLLHCYLVKPVRAVRSGAIFVHAHRWCCYLRVRLHCKPLRQGEICCFYSLATLCQQGRLMPPPNTRQQIPSTSLKKRYSQRRPYLCVYRLFAIYKRSLASQEHTVDGPHPSEHSRKSPLRTLGMI